MFPHCALGLSILGPDCRFHNLVIRMPPTRCSRPTHTHFKSSNHQHLAPPQVDQAPCPGRAREGMLAWGESPHHSFPRWALSIPSWNREKIEGQGFLNWLRAGGQGELSGLNLHPADVWELCSRDMGAVVSLPVWEVPRNFPSL